MDLSDYAPWLSQQGLARNTIEQRVQFAESRIRAWGTLDQPAHVVTTWLNGFQGWTRRTYLNHLRSLYTWLVETGGVAVSPVGRFRTPAAPPPRPHPLSPHELELAIGTADGDLLAWLLLGYLAGLRCHEIAKVRGEDITETAFYVLGKGGQEAVLPTHPLLWDLAQSYPRQGWWFPSVQARREFVSESQIGNKIRDHFRAIGIESGAVHRLRHSYGTTLARNGVQVRVVQDLMRHASLDTTMRYIEVDSAEKAAAVRTLLVTAAA
jgi:integrase